MASERVKFIKHGGKDILFLNFVDCSTNDVLTTIDEAKYGHRGAARGFGAYAHGRDQRPVSMKT